MRRLKRLLCVYYAKNMAQQCHYDRRLTAGIVLQINYGNVYTILASIA